MFASGKNLFFATIAFGLLIAACAYAGEHSPEKVQAPISRGQAQQTAMRQVEGGHVIDERFHDRWFKNDDYEFVIVNDTTHYRIRVDAKTGNVVSVKKKAVFMDHLLTGEHNRLPSNTITPQRVRAIAMERAPHAVIVKIDRFMEKSYLFHDTESDRVVYDVEMQGDDVTIRMMVNGGTGDIQSYEEKRLSSTEK